MPNDELSLKKIFIFWAPLAGTWLMMATEGPFLAAVIARMPSPKYNLAAYGVAFAIAVFMEAPIIMIMSASTALVKNRYTFLKLRRFTYTLNSIITFLMLILLIPPVFHFVATGLIGLKVDVANLTYKTCLVLLPWPAAIGYRRFYQGVLIRSNLTRRVAYGTVVRLTSMSLTALFCYWVLEIPGAVVGGLSLSMGVIGEAIASRIMAHHSVKFLMTVESDDSEKATLTYKNITHFYYPLALTSILGLAVQPLVTFFVGNSRMAIESLAVLPVINSFVFIFRSVGMSFQEVGIALLGTGNRRYQQIRRFAILLGLCMAGIFLVVVFTKLSFIWFRDVSGLSMDLTEFSILPTRILTFIPAMVVLLSLQRAVLVNSRRTKPITIATAIEVTTVIILLIISIQFLGMIGAVAAAISLVVGRFLAVSYLFIPYFKVLKKSA